MNRRAFATSIVIVPTMAGLGYAGWRYFSEKAQHTCSACSREVHVQTRTVAVIDGKLGIYCCPACALSEHRQVGKPVQIMELADYQGGPVISPSQAVLVHDSEINPCKNHNTTLTADKQPLHSHYDRCSPSILAFRDRNSAQRFAAEHGGQVIAFSEMASQFSR
jgi:hypothetical protein